MPKLTLRNRLLAAAGILGFVGAIAAFDLGCPGGTDTAGTAVSHISLRPNPVAVRVGGTVAVNATLTSSDGTVLEGRTVSWSSSNTAVATVSGNTDVGAVTGVSPGTAT